MLLKKFHTLWSRIGPKMALTPIINPISVSSALAEESAIKYLKSGCVIAVPTDTVYGIACDATKPSAINKIYSIKARHKEKPLAVCVSDVVDVGKIAFVEHLPQGLLQALLPGPVTVILNCTNPRLDQSLTLNGKIGIRIPDSNFMRVLARGLQRPLALTSANLSNEPSSVLVTEFSGIWDKLDAVFDGGNLGLNHGASTVVDLSEPGLFYVVRLGVALEGTVGILKRFSLKEI